MSDTTALETALSNFDRFERYADSVIVKAEDLRAALAALATARTENERLRQTIEGYGGWDYWIAEHVRVEDELDQVATALAEANRKITAALKIVKPPHPGDLGQVLYRILSTAPTEQESTP